MNKLKLLIRFDDVCHTMNHDMWNKIVKICDRNNIKPIIAVIPENKDTKFAHEYDDFFWDKIRKLQLKQWGIGLHGLHHTYISNNSGMMKITDLSEFVPRSFRDQDAMVKRGKEIFHKENINVDMFIAPCHSFDKNTIKALKNNNIYTISDGFYTKPVTVEGMKYIPSQLWERSKIPAIGFFTVCCHFENWKNSDLDYFESFIKKYKKNIVSLSDVNEFPNVDLKEKLINIIRINVNATKKNVKKLLKV